MSNPNDFVNDDTPEGNAQVDPHAGQPGVGGMSTEDAEKSYKNAANQHFDTPQEHQKAPKNEKQMTSAPANTPTVPPQAGSVEDEGLEIKD